MYQGKRFGGRIWKMFLKIINFGEGFEIINVCAGDKNPDINLPRFCIDWSYDKLKKKKMTSF